MDVTVFSEPREALPVAPKPSPIESIGLAVTKMTPLQMVLIAFGTIAFLYFARSVVMPIFLACVAAVTLKPLIRWLSYCHLPPPLGAAIVLGVLIAGISLGFFQLGRPALIWIDQAPQHLTELRQRVQKLLPPGARFREAAAAVNNLGATEAEKKEDQKTAPTVQVKDNHSSAFFINWTEVFLAGLIETLVLLYLLLASGDLFLQKLV